MFVSLKTFYKDSFPHFSVFGSTKKKKLVNEKLSLVNEKS